MITSKFTVKSNTIYSHRLKVRKAFLIHEFMWPLEQNCEVIDNLVFSILPIFQVGNWSYKVIGPRFFFLHRWLSWYLMKRKSADFGVGASLVAQTVRNLPAIQETWVWSLGQEEPLEKEMTTCSSALAWRIPSAEEPGRLKSMGLKRFGNDLATEQQQNEYLRN